MTDRPNASPLRVLVLMGGPDAEREVSLMSGREVAAALRDSNRFEVHEEVIATVTAEELRGHGADVVFPVLHGHWGEGGPLQEELERLGLPYVGSRPRAARLAMDKLATKLHASASDVPTPRSRELRRNEACDLEPPLVVKPVDDGSSVDLRICRSTEEVERARHELEPRRPRLMAESYVKGRELTVGIVGTAALPVIEIIPAVEYYDYQAKYIRDDTRYVVDPPLPSGVAERLTALSMRMFERLGCRDVARVDFMLEERPGGPECWFLEINTMPGFTTHSLVPMAARHRGMPMSALCAFLVERALERRPVAMTGVAGADRRRQAT